MSDTISAAKAWSPGDVRMNFLASADVAPPPPDLGNFHVSGGTYNTYSSPSLIVQFTTATPDIPGWSVAVAAQPPPESISGYAAHLTEVTRPVIVGAFNTN